MPHTAATLAARTGLPATTSGLPREQFAAARRACGDLNGKLHRAAAKAGEPTVELYGYERDANGRMSLTTSTATVRQVDRQVRDLHRWAIARHRDRSSRTVCAAGARSLRGRAPRTGANSRRRGSRRAVSRSCSRGGDSGEPDLPDQFDCCSTGLFPCGKFRRAGGATGGLVRLTFPPATATAPQDEVATWPGRTFTCCHCPAAFKSAPDGRDDSDASAGCGEVSPP